MYIPESFKEDRPAVLSSFIEKNAFATIITSGSEGPNASHLPFIYNSKTGAHGLLESHMAKANRHWPQFESAGQTLVIFHGPHAYISPTLYKSEFAVPTWNYAAVHVYGVPKIITEAADLQSLLDKLVSTYESVRHPSWSVSWKDERYKDLLNSIALCPDLS